MGNKKLPKVTKGAARNHLLRKVSSAFLVLTFLFTHISTALLAPSQTVLAAGTDVELSFTELGTHPQVAAEPADWQRQITELTLFNGKLLAGYGDYNSNTGPIEINPFNISTGTFEGVSVMFPSESIGNWKVINGKLYTTNIDARGCYNCAIGYAVSADGSNWEIKSPVTGLHIYDIETLTGTDLWLFGSVDAGNDEGVAAVWRSLDDGETWNEVETPSPGGNRYYWGTAMNGKMYFQAFDGVGFEVDDIDPVQVFDGTNWTTGTTEPVCYAGDHNGGPNPVVFNDKIVCYWTDHLRTFDGTEVVEVVPSNITTTLTEPGARLFNGVAGDTKVTSDAYYMIDFTQSFDVEKPEQILRSPDLVRWQSLQGLPSKTTAMAIDEEGDKIYVGTADAKLFAADLPALSELPFPGEPEEPGEDMNNDGVADVDQENVSVLISPVTGKSVVLELSDECDIQSFEVKSETQAETQDAQFNYTDGLVDFTAGCGSAGVTSSVKIFLYDANLSESNVRKYNPNTGTYTAIDGAALEQQAVNEREVTLLSYSVTDGSELDVDGLANGVIVDPVGAGVAINTGSGGGAAAGGSAMSSLARTGLPQYIFLGIALTAISLTSYFVWQHNRFLKMHKP